MVLIRKGSIAALALVALAACGRASAPPMVPAASLVDDAGQTRALRQYVAQAPYTVVVFFSATCPVQKAHDERLRALYDKFHARGVQFLAVDSEEGASTARDDDEAKARSYAFPIWVDRGAAVANAMGADFATYTVVVDRDGKVRYEGGIDSDRGKLHDDATMYVADALEDLLAGREPRLAHGKTLGCALRKP